uniref:Uncharacterized protein n=1 Tax=Rhizophora mucronata TaxID=61149 RepID=A0A2P2NWW4_RHIMU
MHHVIVLHIHVNAFYVETFYVYLSILVLVDALLLMLGIQHIYI